MSDAYKSLRELPFSAVATTLGIDLSTFKNRTNGEHYGKCPLHDAKNNKTSFSYSPDGKFHCFSCEAKGRGAIDLAMQVLKIGFKDACERLGSISPPTPETPNLEAPTHEFGALKKNTWLNYQVESEWLQKRCPYPDILKHYDVFVYCNPARKSNFTNHVMLPFRHHETGEIWGYLGRNTG